LDWPHGRPSPLARKLFFCLAFPFFGRRGVLQALIRALLFLCYFCDLGWRYLQARQWDIPQFVSSISCNFVIEISFSKDVFEAEKLEAGLII
jgi:hypothetical protein